MFGDAGSDRIHGGNGDDEIADGEFDGGVTDYLYGGAGDDLFLPVNTPTAVKDVIHCGGGYDTVYVDRADKTFNDCERVKKGVPPPR
jgi:Ca2+-binding RTX toxin-like protein